MDQSRTIHTEENNKRTAESAENAEEFDLARLFHGIVVQENFLTLAFFVCVLCVLCGEITGTPQ